jgi:hypothetical protein
VCAQSLHRDHHETNHLYHLRHHGRQQHLDELVHGLRHLDAHHMMDVQLVELQKQGPLLRVL